jgi:hypothetical protein
MNSWDLAMPPHPLRWTIIIIPSFAQALPQPQADTAECVGQLVLNLEISAETSNMNISKYWPIAVWHHLWNVKNRVVAGRNDDKPIAIALAVWHSFHRGTCLSPAQCVFWNPGAGEQIHWTPGFRFHHNQIVGTNSNGSVPCTAWGPHLCSWLLSCHCGRHPWCRWVGSPPKQGLAALKLHGHLVT